MFKVIKRSGEEELVDYDKIYKRISALCWDLDMEFINVSNIVNDVKKSMTNNIHTEEIDFLSADICASKIIMHPDYNKLAARLCVSNLHKNTDDNILNVIKKLYDNCDKFGEHSPLISNKLLDIVEKNHEKIEEKIDYSRDYFFDFFGIKTLERSYLMRVKHIKGTEFVIGSNKENKLKRKYGKILERPQHLIMRVALGIHEYNLEKAFETYDLISNRYFTHATPTLYNAGTNRSQNSSCYLLGCNDSIDAMYKLASDCAKISKWAGGIGVHLSSIRCNGSLIRGTNGSSDGIIPYCKVLNRVAKHVNQGGRRNGSIACYLEVWHGDIWEFIELRRREGDEEQRARDLFLALWICDLFMKRVIDDKMWSLMCPDECPNLISTYGDEFEKLYVNYEKQGKFRKQIKARELWHHILVSQIETGMPYMLYKDHVNRKNNQANLGTIRSSNLCCEITEYSDDNEYAVCNLASICLPKFLKMIDGKLSFDFKKLYEVSMIATENLNKIIDVNFYPVPETKKSNMKHRPVGLGVQGLADVYNKLKYPFGSDEAMALNKKIFETIYFGSLTKSNELAKKEGPYESFKGSPFSEGKLQFHLWGLKEEELSGLWDWKPLIENIKKYGTRNSLLTTVMPTASTSQIMGNVECIEPYTKNLYVRTTIAGEYIVINENLVRDLLELGLWNEDVRNELMFDTGSIQKIDCIPQYLKDVYKTASEVRQYHIVRQAVERGPFIDQSQSMNIFMQNPDFKKLTNSHFYAWNNGLKTGQYYLRSDPAVDAISFGLDQTIINKIKEKRGIAIIEIDENNIPELDNDIDPRRINEIEQNLKPKVCPLRRKGIPYDECEACGS